MYYEKNQKLIIAISWFAVLICMFVIFYFSNQPATVSNRESEGIVRSEVQKVIDFAKIKIDKNNLDMLIGNINSMARNYMHGVVFLLLGALVLNAMLRSKARFKYNITVIWISVAICLAYGILDETHQIFIPGRTFQLSDIAMDVIGSIIGIGILWLINYRILRRKNGTFKTTW